VRRILCAAAAAALGATGTAHAIVQDFNRARGADGYTLTNAAGDQSGTFDGQEFQPAPSSPGLNGEFWFAGTGLGQPFDLDVRAPLGQGVTGTPNDHGGYMFVDYKGPAGGPFYWYGGTGNVAGPFPGIVLPGGGAAPQVPDLSQVLAYADVLAPAGKQFRFYINSPYDGQDHQFSITGTGTGAWQTVGGDLGRGDPDSDPPIPPIFEAINGGVVYANAPFDTPNQMAMTVQFAAPEIVNWDNGTDVGPAVLRVDNLTFTPANVLWGATGGGNWSDNANWSPLRPNGIPMAPSGRNALAFFGSSAAPQTVTLDSPVVSPWTPTGGGDYPTANNFYVGTLQFDSAQPYTLAGTEPLYIDTTAANGTDLAGPGGTIKVVNGSHTISAPVVMRRSTLLDVAAGSTLTISGPLTVFSSDALPVTLAKAGAGTAVVNNVRVTGSLEVGAGTLRIALNGGPAGVSYVPGPLTVAAGARLDLTDNKVITSNPVGTFSGGAYDGVSGLVASGRAGNWTGSGIVTSDSRATGVSGDLVSIGVAKVGDFKTIADTATTTFAGQTVLGTDTVAMVTYGGDANLDGKINIDDYGRIDGNVGQSGSVFGWSKGDFNYDGKINIDDYGIIDGNINRQGMPFLTVGVPDSAGMAAVPEPSLALPVILLAGLTGRRRRVGCVSRMEIAS
jgi:hypothetical protein